MATGHFIGLGDKTSCGGEVLDADATMIMFGFARAREGDRVSCGKDGETYQTIGGVPNMRSNGRRVAGTLDSVSSRPCRAKLISSNTSASCQSSNEPASTHRAAASVATSPPAAQKLSKTTPASPVLTPAFKSLWGEEPGFYIVPQSMSREALIAELFDNFTPAASYRFHSLNPHWDIVKAGTLVVLSDPATCSAHVKNDC